MFPKGSQPSSTQPRRSPDATSTQAPTPAFPRKRQTDAYPTTDIATEHNWPYSSGHKVCLPHRAATHPSRPAQHASPVTHTRRIPVITLPVLARSLTDPATLPCLGHSTIQKPDPWLSLFSCESRGTLAAISQVPTHRANHPPAICQTSPAQHLCDLTTSTFRIAQASSLFLTPWGVFATPQQQSVCTFRGVLVV